MPKQRDWQREPKMDKFKFYKILLDLEMFFGKKLVDWQREQYCKHLGMFPEGMFRESVDWLIANHKYRSIPLIAEIKDTLNKIQARDSETSMQDLEKLSQTIGCEICKSTGFKLTQKETITAQYCECELGQRIKRGNKRYFIEKRKRIIGENQ